jgi:Holliday junction resolvasome RuvABC endonuclease subunit
MRIMGFDPGGTTGVAAIDVDWDETRFEPDPSKAHVMNTQLPAVWGTGLGAIGTQISDLIDKYQPDLIVIENFIITQRTLRYTRQPDALHIIGGVRFLADLREIPVHIQTSSLAKTTWDSKRITSSGWGKVVKNKHARDALRHALTACATWKPAVK